MTDAGALHHKTHWRTISFRVTPIEAALIEANAKHYGKTLSQWLREAAITYRPRSNTEVFGSDNTVKEGSD